MGFVVLKGAGSVKTRESKGNVAIGPGRGKNTSAKITLAFHSKSNVYGGFA
jgi:hypothetical protein